MPRLTRESDGMIQSVDEDDRTFTINMKNESQVRKFEWNERTEFVQDRRFTTSAGLKKGVIVRIRYRVPFLGKPFVTKVMSLIDHSFVR